MKVWYTAPVGKKRPVDFTYDITEKSEAGKMNGNAKKNYQIAIEGRLQKQNSVAIEEYYSIALALALFSLCNSSFVIFLLSFTVSED